MIQQNTPDWFEMRRNYIGASDATVVMGVSPWKTAYQLWEEKLGMTETPQTTSAMSRGHELEPLARELYSKITGNIVDPKVVFHEKHKFLMASLDGITSDYSIILEIKCPGRGDHDIAKEGNIPDKYFPQLQHQLACVKSLCKNRNILLHYFSYFSEDDYSLVEVKPDDLYIEDMIAKEADFWDCVQNWKAPELSEKDFVQRDDNEWSQAAILWKDAKESLKFWEEQEKEARNALIKLSKGQSSVGGGVKLSKVNRRGAVDYSAIPELKGVDLEAYRKKSFETWRLS